MELFQQCERCEHVRYKGNPCSKNLYEAQDGSWKCSGFERIRKSKQQLISFADKRGSEHCENARKKKEDLNLNMAHDPSVYDRGHRR